MSEQQKQSIKLDVELGCSSIAGAKPINEDAVQAHIPVTEHALINKGVSVVIADGVSSAEAGRQASQYSVGHLY